MVYATSSAMTIIIIYHLTVEVCYVKMWLQLVFPFYWFFVALIIGSYYSTKIQRLTAQRAFPVLAMLFLSAIIHHSVYINGALFVFIHYSSFK